MIEIQADADTFRRHEALRGTGLEQAQWINVAACQRECRQRQRSPEDAGSGLSTAVATVGYERYAGNDGDLHRFDVAGVHHLAAKILLFGELWAPIAASYDRDGEE